MGENTDTKDCESTAKECGSSSEVCGKLLPSNSQRKKDSLNINSPSGGYKIQVNRDVNETSPVIKSRYGRTHKPKIPEDFLPTDKKVAAILGHSPHKSPAKPINSSSSSPNDVAKVCQKGRKVYDIFTKKERISKGNRESGEIKNIFSVKEAEIIDRVVSENVKVKQEITEEKIRNEIKAEDSFKKSPQKNNSVLDEKFAICEWKVGDLAWARVSGYPFWPCMIALDPEQGIYTKSTVRGSFTLRSLHVQFFGDNGRRSWLYNNCVIPFEGLDALNRLSAKVQNEVKKRDKKLIAAFHIGAKSRVKWDIAVAEAEESMTKTRASRLQEFAMLFPHDASKKKKTESSSVSPNDKVSFGKLNKSFSPADKSSTKHNKSGRRSDSMHRSPLKEVKRENEDQHSDQSPFSGFGSGIEMESTPTRKKKNQYKKYKTIKPLRGDFNLYLYKNLDRVSQEYPDLDAKSVEKYLAKEWKNMDNDERSKYCARMNSSEAVLGSPDTSSYEEEEDEEEEDEEAECDEEEEEEEEEEEGMDTQTSNEKIKKPKTKRLKITSRYGLKKGGGLFRGTKQEKVCQICEKPGDTVKCRGPCCGSFHLDCVSKLIAEGKTIVEIPSPIKKKENLIYTKQEENDSSTNENSSEEDQAEAKTILENNSLEENHEASKEILKATVNGITNVGHNSTPMEFQKKRKRQRSGENSCSDSETENNVAKRRRHGESPASCIEKPNSEEMEDATDDDKMEMVKPMEHATRGSSSDKENVVEEDCNRTQEKVKFENEVMLDDEKILSENNLDDTCNIDSGKTKDMKLTEKKGIMNSNKKEQNCNTVQKMNIDKTEDISEITCDETKTLTVSAIIPNERPKRELRRSVTKKEIYEMKDFKSVKNKNKEARNTPQEKNEKKDRKSFNKKKEKQEKGKECETDDKTSVDSILEFRCPDCQLGQNPPCFACGTRKELKTGNEQRQRCAVGHCGKFYHPECLKLWPHAWSSGASRRQSAAAARKQDLIAVTCPQHVCHTCASDDPRNATTRFNHERLLRCIRCPTAYHTGNYCLPAGSEVLTGSQIICPKHYKPPQKKTYHVNAAWCFICAMGGSLICCDLCPTSFHAECLKISPPEGSFICEDCDTGRFPLYGEIVWVKLGAYRWWPAQILYPNQIPDNIQNLPHVRGEFAVRFFGSRDHYWVNRGRVFLYQEGDTGHSTSRKSYMEGTFSRALLEASEAHKTLKGEKATRDAEARPVMKPPMYVKIKSNKPVGNVRVMEMDPASMTPCDCDPKSENPCGPETDCLNRILLVECSPSVCLAGENCGNQCFEKRQYPPVVPYRTETRGWGLKTLADIRKGDFVIEYVGEMIDETEYQRRMSRKHEEKDENYYFLTIDKDRMLDAGPKGNVSRFMNHSCQPNCETQKWTVNGDTRVGLFALDNIAADTELTFNYNLESAGTDKKPCMCGAPNCSGFIGMKATKQFEEDKKSRAEQQNFAKRRKKRRSDTRTTDNLCFICGEGGQLLLCDNKTCPKGYHLQCLKLKHSPHGKWLCPWHRCNECNKRTVRRCSYCPNSFCPCHSEGKISLHPTRGLICSEHNEISTSIKEELVESVLENKMDVEVEGSEVVSSPDSENSPTVIKETDNEESKDLTYKTQADIPSTEAPNLNSSKEMAVSIKHEIPDLSEDNANENTSINKSENAVTEENMTSSKCENSHSALNDSVLKRKRGRPRKSTTEEREDESNHKSFENAKLSRIDRCNSENPQYNDVSVNGLEEPVKRGISRPRKMSVDSTTKSKLGTNKIDSDFSNNAIEQVQKPCKDSNDDKNVVICVDNMPLQKDDSNLEEQTKCNERKEDTTVNGIETPGRISLPVER